MATLINKQLLLTSATTQAIQAAVTGKRVYVTSFSFGVSAATALPQLEDTTGTPVVLAGPYDNAAPVACAGTRDTPLLATDSGKGLTLRTAGAGNVRGHICYFLGD